MNSDRLPSLAIWTRISCDALLLVATDYAPTQADGLAAWGITLAASYLIFCWIHRKTESERAAISPGPLAANI